MYEAHFNLSGKPFQLNPDPDFFFASSGHNRALSYLQYGLHQAEGFIVLTGEVGAGKTTLVRGLMRTLPAEAVQSATIVSSDLRGIELLGAVALEFGITAPAGDKPALLDRLRCHFEALQAQGKRAVLIVDEAQNLSVGALEELRMLSNFQDGKASLLQTFLVGQPQFRDTLQRPDLTQLKQRVIGSFHLEALGAVETRDYIEFRLKRVGWHQTPLIATRSFDAIHAASGGIPRRINLICDRLLLAAFLDKRHVLDEALVENVTCELTDELGARASGPVTSPINARDGERSEYFWRLIELEQRLRDNERLTRTALDIAGAALALLAGSRSGELASDTGDHQHKP